MRILSVSLKNIKSHRDRELHFVSGINVLSGVNGVGKSTVFEAIGYGLFGVDARDFVGNIDRFVTIGEKKGEIRVLFETDQGETFQVSRTVGAGSKWLLARKMGESFEIEEHAGAAETEGRIKKLLGLDSGRSLAEQFKLMIGPFQNEFLGPFVVKQPRKRQEAFDEILGIDAWRKTYKGTSTLLKAVKSKIEVLDVQITNMEEQTAVLPEKQKELTAYATEAETYHKELAAREKDLDDLQTSLAVLDAREKKVSGAKTEIQILENRLTDGTSKIDDQKKLVAEAEEAVVVVEKSRRGKEIHETAEADLKALREKEKQKRALEKEIIALEKESGSHSQTLAHEETEVKNTDTRLHEEEQRLQQERQALIPDKTVSQQAAGLEKLRSQADKIRSTRGMLEGQRAGLLDGKAKLAEGVCPFFKEECRNIAGQAPRDVFSARIAELEDETSALNKRLHELTEQISTAEKARQRLDSAAVREKEIGRQLLAIEKRREENSRRKKKLKDLQIKLAEAEKMTTARRRDLEPFSNLDADIEKVEKRRSEFQQARDAFYAHQKIAGDLENRRHDLKRMTQLFLELKTSLAAKKEESARLTNEYDANHHEKVRRAKEKLVADIATVKEKIGAISRDRQRIEKEVLKLEGLRCRIKEGQAEKKELLRKERLVEFLRNKIFNNVSMQLSERFREEISLRADRIYRTIAETDEELVWGENYQIILRDMQNGEIRERVDDQLSGGQIMSAVVALRLALLQTIGARIAFFDEPTSNLDAARRENLAHAFRAIDIGREEVTEHWYDQLFLISHDVAFTEITDQIISLE